MEPSCNAGHIVSYFTLDEVLAPQIDGGKSSCVDRYVYLPGSRLFANYEHAFCADAADGTDVTTGMAQYVINAHAGTLKHKNAMFNQHWKKMNECANKKWSMEQLESKLLQDSKLIPKIGGGQIDHTNLTVNHLDSITVIDPEYQEMVAAVDRILLESVDITFQMSRLMPQIVSDNITTAYIAQMDASLNAYCMNSRAYNQGPVMNRLGNSVHAYKWNLAEMRWSALAETLLIAIMNFYNSKTAWQCLPSHQVKILRLVSIALYIFEHGGADELSLDAELKESLIRDALSLAALLKDSTITPEVVKAWSNYELVLYIAGGFVILEFCPSQQSLTICTSSTLGSRTKFNLNEHYIVMPLKITRQKAVTASFGGGMFGLTFLQPMTRDMRMYNCTTKRFDNIAVQLEAKICDFLIPIHIMASTSVQSYQVLCDAFSRIVSFIELCGCITNDTKVSILSKLCKPSVNGEFAGYISGESEDGVSVGMLATCLNESLLDRGYICETSVMCLLATVLGGRC